MLPTQLGYLISGADFRMLREVRRDYQYWL